MALRHGCPPAYCTLHVAASVIGLYSSVAYIIAFLVELWWIWETRGQVPYLGYILTVGYLVSFFLSAILVTGISNRRLSYLVVWMTGLSAIILPEAGLALFMSLQFWRLSTVHGLTEVTSWACRLAVNVGGLVCVQWLYTRWREEKQVMASLRHLNTAAGNATGCDGSRRNSASTLSTNARIDRNTATGQDTLRRWGSVRSLPGVLVPSEGSQFDASLFETDLGYSTATATAAPVGAGLHSHSRPQLLYRSNSVSYSPRWADDRVNKGYFGAARGGWGHHHHEHVQQETLAGNTTATRGKSRSRTSLAESDDAYKYRDVAL